MYKILTIGMAVIMAGITLTIMNTSAIFATTDEEPDPNTVGKVTKERNADNRNDDSEPGASETGRHASDPNDANDNGPSDTGCIVTGDDNGRCGLALNRGNEGNPQGSPQGTIEFVCGLDPEAAGCDALDDN